MFADTTNLSSKRKSLCSNQSELDNLLQWFCQNRLSINRDTCEAVAFGRGHPSEILITDKNSFFERVQVFRCLRGQNFALQRTY